MGKNKKIKIRDVYNRIFFSTFDLDGVRIYNKEEELEQQTDNKRTEITSSSGDIDTSKENKTDFADVFGKEQKPSGYSELPLYKNEDGTVSQ